MVLNLRSYFTRALVVVAVWLLPHSLNTAQERIPVDAMINGQPVHLLLDTPGTGPMLFRSTAERSKLFVLRRLNLIVDGINGVVYAHPNDEPPPPYPCAVTSSCWAALRSHIPALTHSFLHPGFSASCLF